MSDSEYETEYKELDLGAAEHDTVQTHSDTETSGDCVYVVSNDHTPLYYSTSIEKAKKCLWTVASLDKTKYKDLYSTVELSPNSDMTSITVHGYLMFYIMYYPRTISHYTINECKKLK